MGRTWVLALLVVASAACPKKGGGPGGSTFAITYPDAPPSGVTAKKGAHFYAKPAGQCFHDNGREAGWRMAGARVTAGELPPGLTLEDGVIGGVPTKPGTYKATIELSEVTCAGSPPASQVVDVQITVK